MTKRLLITFFLTATISSFSSADTRTDQEITRFFTELSESLNIGDINKVGRSWSEDGELISLAGGIFKGSLEIKKLYREALSGPYKGAKFHFYIQYIRSTDQNRAVVDGVWKITDGGPANYPSCGIFLYNLSKENGRWLIDLAYSSVPRPGHTREHGRTLSWVEICKDSQQLTSDTKQRSSKIVSLSAPLDFPKFFK